MALLSVTSISAPRVTTVTRTGVCCDCSVIASHCGVGFSRFRRAFGTGNRMGSPSREQKKRIAARQQRQAPRGAGRGVVGETSDSGLQSEIGLRQRSKARVRAPVDVEVLAPHAEVAVAPVAEPVGPPPSIPPVTDELRIEHTGQDHSPRLGECMQASEQLVQIVNEIQGSEVGGDHVDRAARADFRDPPLQEFPVAALEQLHLPAGDLLGTVTAKCGAHARLDIVCRDLQAFPGIELRVYAGAGAEVENVTAGGGNLHDRALEGPARIAVRFPGADGFEILLASRYRRAHAAMITARGASLAVRARPLRSRKFTRPDPRLP